MSSIKVSVCVPVYNVASSLEVCLDSIINQTLQDIEIICVDDGSTDNSLEILERYREKDGRIVVIHKENGGLPSARNAALDVAKGEYVGFVDSDDFIQDNMYERLYGVATEEKCDVVICGANIYPDEPRAPQWYYDTLSPSERLYEEYTPDLLYSCVDTSPFLWRTMIRRSLIEENNLRLDEEITLGEDKAFQAKIYPHANRIKVIGDKLYNYNWFRTDSLMEKDTRKVSDKKGRLHSKLILSIVKSGDFSNKNEAIQFLKWSIPFLYADFITVSLNEKAELAQRLVDAWNSIGYQNFKYEIEEWIRDEFQYFEEMSITETEKPVISVVMSITSIGKRALQCIDEVRKQSISAIEIIVINNGADINTWHKLEYLIKKDSRIRIYNTPNHIRFGDEVKAGIELAEGEYIHFYVGDGRYANANALNAWYMYAKNNEVEVCGTTPLCSNSFAVANSESYITFSSNDTYEIVSRLRLEHVLFNKDYLLEIKYIMRCLFDFTGDLFVALVTYNSKKIDMFSENVYVSKSKWKKDWLSTKQCEYLLTTIRDCVETAINNNQLGLVNYLYGVICDEDTKQIILNNTKMYAMHQWERPEGDNSQYEIVNELYRLMSIYPAEQLFDAGYYSDYESMTILPDIIIERQKYLNSI